MNDPREENYAQNEKRLEDPVGGAREEAAAIGEQVRREFEEAAELW